MKKAKKKPAANKPVTFNGQKYPVVDATTDFPIYVTKEAVESNNNREDANHCVAAECIREQTGLPVMMRVDTALVGRPQQDGGYVFYRYRYPTGLRKAVAAFDAEEKFKDGFYLLRAPTASQLLEFRRANPSKKQTENTREVSAHRRSNRRTFAVGEW